MTEPEYVEFTPASPEAVLGRMAEIAESHVGWINFEPAVYVEDAPPPRSPLYGLISSRGPDVPVATWTPGEVGRRRVDPPQVGILHPSGPNAKRRLAEAGYPVPEGWVVTQDYGKKGLVVAVPPSVSHEDVLAWLLRATAALSVIPLTGTWRAVIYGG